MKSVLLAISFSSVVFATGASCADLSLLENCLKLHGTFDDAKTLFSDDHNPDQKAEFLPRLYSDFRFYGQVTRIAGGPEARAVLEEYEAEEGSAILGHVFTAPVTLEVAQCKLPNEDKHTCGPIYALLDKTAAALISACANDYQKAQN